jgi:hypothetical protein
MASENALSSFGLSQLAELLEIRISCLLLEVDHPICCGLIWIIVVQGNRLVGWRASNDGSMVAINRHTVDKLHATQRFVTG